MQRIVLLGCAGAGKSTLARRLGNDASLPVIFLDALWQQTSGEGQVDRFCTAVRDAHAGERWVSDGNFAQTTFDIRLPRATLIVWLEQPVSLCLLRAASRIFRPEEPHRLRGILDAFAYIWRFDRVNRPLIESMRSAAGPAVPVRRLRGNREVAAFLAESKGR